MPSGEASGAGPRERRNLLSKASFIAMAAAIAASYGTLLVFVGRFLFPARRCNAQWVYVGRLKALKPAQTVLYETPAGETVNVARRAVGASLEAEVTGR